MKSFSANIARGIRLRLKTGYLKEEPAEYLFMKRYPPLNGNRQNVTRPIQAKNIPYLKLYDKVVERNPLYVDERVYPAYWEQDVTPLAIAKRQYDLMQQGMSEEDAYYKAQEYVEELEGKAFDEMQALINAALSMGATSSFATDEAVAADIARWREKLADVPYNELSLADQGEIDHLVHSKILKWNAVHTEIRMKDPVFYSTFRELRAVIFPMITETDDELARTMPSREVENERVDTRSRRTNLMFYYEKYAEFFGQFKANPDTLRWTNIEREKLSKWVNDSLSIRQATDELQGRSIADYREEIKSQFFPMIRFPDAVASFQLPSPDQLRQTLFEHGVGYRTDSNGLFIHRFYKLPRLLFPAETLALSLARNKTKAAHYLADPFFLSLVLEKEGYSADLQPLITERLSELVRRALSKSNYSRGGFGGIANGDISDEASDEINQVLKESLEDELEDSLLGGGQRQGVQPQRLDRLEDRKGYHQMAFIALLASNWKVVLNELDTPGIYEALDRVCNGDGIAEIIAEARAKESEFEPQLVRLAHVVDTDAISVAVQFAEKIIEADVRDVETARTLRYQAYRRALVERAIEVLSYYYTLKDDPENNGISFPLDMPFQELNYDEGMSLFESDEELMYSDAPKQPRKVREKEFQKALRLKMGGLLQPPLEEEPPTPTKDEMSTEDWNKVSRKYYTPPKSKLQFLREEWINSLATKEGTTWERMQDLKDEDSLKFMKRMRLDVQMVVRGQLAIEFENKEGARRQREFKRRGVHMNVQPYPLECIDN